MLATTRPDLLLRSRNRRACRLIVWLIVLGLADRHRRVRATNQPALITAAIE